MCDLCAADPIPIRKEGDKHFELVDMQPSEHALLLGYAGP